MGERAAPARRLPMRFNPEIDLARSAQRAAASWHRAQQARIAGLKRQILGAELDCDTARVIALKHELESVHATARRAAEDVVGYRRIAQRLASTSSQALHGASGRVRIRSSRWWLGQPPRRANAPLVEARKQPGRW